MPEKFVGHIQLELKNIACFREFSVDLRSGEVTEVTGGNGRGKSTLLTCLKNNVTGKPVSFPDWLVTDFEDKGTIRANVDDMVTVQRDVKAGETASALSLLDENGWPLNGGKRQMETLRALFGDGTYLNPIEIVTMRPADRAKAIASALPIDPQTAADALAAITGRPVEIKTREDIFPSIQRAHDSLYELRRQKRNEYEAADAQAEGVLAYVPAEWQDAKGQIPPPVEPPPLGDIYDRKRAAEVRNGERVQLMQDIAELEETIRQGDERIAGYELQLSQKESELHLLGEPEDEAALEEQIKQLQLQLAAMQERNRQRRELSGRIATARETIERNKATLDQYRVRLTEKQARETQLGGWEDTSALQAQIDAHENQMEIYKRALQEHGEKRIRYEQAEQLRAKADKVYAEWEDLDKKVRRIDRLPIDLLDGVQVPIPGMQISGDQIFLPDGDTLRPFDAFGDADKLRYAALMAMELAPVNILILDGVEKCDEDRRLELYRMAAEKGFLVFSTRVTKGPLKINHLTPDKLAVSVGDKPDELPVEIPGELPVLETPEL